MRALPHVWLVCACGNAPLLPGDASVDATRAAGEWQTLDVELVGRRVTVVLNGTTIIDGQEIPGITGGALDSAEGEPGPIMLQGDHGAIELRNLTIALPR